MNDKYLMIEGIFTSAKTRKALLEIVPELNELYHYSDHWDTYVIKELDHWHGKLNDELDPEGKLDQPRGYDHTEYFGQKWHYQKYKSTYDKYLKELYIRLKKVMPKFKSDMKNYNKAAKPILQKLKNAHEAREETKGRFFRTDLEKVFKEISLMYKNINHTLKKNDDAIIKDIMLLKEIQTGKVDRKNRVIIIGHTDAGILDEHQYRHGLWEY